MKRRWHTVPASTVQGVHAPCTCRLQSPYVNFPGPFLPNGLPRPDRIKIEASFRLGGDFHFLARVVRHGERGTLLQVQTEAFDTRCHRLVHLAVTDTLLSQVYAELARRYLAAQGRAYGRGEGRN